MELPYVENKHFLDHPFEKMFKEILIPMFKLVTSSRGGEEHITSKYRF